MFFSKTTGLSLLLGATVLLSAQEALAQDAVKQAGATFRKSCVDCHTIPDKKFATDKAWLLRVKDTA